MSYPADLKYRDSHEWVRVEGNVATVGVSWFAQDSLGDVVHVEMPEIGDSTSAGATIGEIESVKAVSDIYSPVSGEVIAINEGLDGNEELVNDDPYGEGWLFQIRMSSTGELDSLRNAEDYQAHCEA